MQLAKHNVYNVVLYVSGLLSAYVETIIETTQLRNFIVVLGNAINYSFLTDQYLPRGVGASICGFHPQDPGSIPGVGTLLCIFPNILTQKITYFQRR